MFLRQSLRHRRLQTVVLLGVSTLIGACAAFGPLFARAVEQSITTTTLTEQRAPASFLLSAGPSQSHLVLDRDDPNHARTVSPERLGEVRPDGFDAKFEPPVYGMTVNSEWLKPGQRLGAVQAALSWVDRLCDHLVTVEGSSPAKAGEVAVSATDQGNYGVGVGGRLMTTSTDHPRPAALRITGVYRADAGDPVWYGVTPTGRSRPGELGGAGDTVFTPRATFEQETWGHTSSAQSAALPGRLRLDDLPALVDWVNGINPSLDAMGGVTLRTQLPDVVNRISDGRRQAVSIIPLVMIQVAIFGLVVLALTAGAVIDQRRPELAIGRLRGRGAARAGREVFAEMGLLVTIGTVAGFAVAFVVTTAVRSTLR